MLNSPVFTVCYYFWRGYFLTIRKPGDNSSPSRNNKHESSEVDGNAYCFFQCPENRYVTMGIQKLSSQQTITSTSNGYLGWTCLRNVLLIVEATSLEVYNALLVKKDFYIKNITATHRNVWVVEGTNAEVLTQWSTTLKANSNNCTYHVNLAICAEMWWPPAQ